MKKVCTVVCLCSLLSSTSSTFSFGGGKSAASKALVVFGMSKPLHKRTSRGSEIKSLKPLDLSVLATLDFDEDPPTSPWRPKDGQIDPPTSPFGPKKVSEDVFVVVGRLKRYKKSA